MNSYFRDRTLGNDAGGNIDSNPHFLFPPDPALAPTTLGNCTLHSDSPAISGGDTAAAPSPLDLAGKSRVLNGNIEIGALEFDSTEFIKHPQSVSAHTILADSSGSYANFPDFSRLYNLQPDTVILLSNSNPALLSVMIGTGPEVILEPTGVTGTTDLVFEVHSGPASVAHPLRISTITPRIYVKSTATGSSKGNSWENAFTKLQDAISTAVGTTVPPQQPIWVASGTYFPDEGGGNVDNDRFATFHLIDGVELIGAFRGDELSPDDRSTKNSPSVLSGEIGSPANKTDNSYHIVTGESIGASAVLDGFTIRSGYANGTSSELDGIRHSVAGGLFLDAASPVISKCRFENNYAGDFGGANYNHGGSAPLFTDCVFSENTGLRGGGAVNNRYSPARFENCIFFKNSAPGTYADGGAVSCDNSSGAFVNCAFAQNSANFNAGAISNNNSAFTVSNSIMWGNSSRQSSSLDYVKNLTISHSLIQGLSGTDPRSPPLFVNLGSGDLRVFKGSPTIDAGDNAANGLLYDIFGNARILSGVIDMGPYEGGVDASFWILYPGLDPKADANGNGVSNFYEYASGVDPRQMSSVLPAPAYSDGILSLQYRENDPDLIVTYQKSATLEPDSWMDLESSDYTVNEATSKGGVRSLNLEMPEYSNGTSNMFYRIRFSSAVED